MVRVAAALLLALALPCAGANSMLHAGQGKVFDGKEAPVLLRCVNLSPWLDPEPYLIGKSFKALFTSPSDLKRKLAELVGPEAAASFWREWQKAFVTEEDFSQLAQQGFNCARLPLNSNYITRGFVKDQPVLDEEGLAPVDDAVAWSETHGLYLVLDLHAAPGGQNPAPTVSDVPANHRTAGLWEGDNAAANRSRTIALWHALASRYASRRSVAGYDLLNEPELPSHVPASALMQLYRDIIAAIRSTDPMHMVIVEGNHYARDVSSLLPPPDPNILYEFHEYDLFNHAWKIPNAAALEPFLRLRATSQKPLWLGEFGENTETWQAQMVALMKAHGIGWAVWPWKRIDLGNGHPVMETIVMPSAWEKLSAYLVGALFAAKPSPAQTREAMTQMLEAIRTAHCRKDPRLAHVLVGQQ